MNHYAVLSENEMMAVHGGGEYSAWDHVREAFGCGPSLAERDFRDFIERVKQKERDDINRDSQRNGGWGERHHGGR